MIISLNDQALTSGLKAGAMIKSVAATFGGGGGGRPNLAQAGGKNPAGLPAAITQAIKLIEEN